MDLDDIWLFIAIDNVLNADRFVEKLQNICIHTIGPNPEIGRQREEIAAGLRSFPYRDYLILYRIDSDYVGIVRVVHGSREIENLEV